MDLRELEDQREVLDTVWESLSDAQQEFIAEQVKRGKKTTFAREIAKSKGFSITDTMSDFEISQLIDDWILVDFIDAGPNWQSGNLRCECGRKLRRQYSVANKTTGATLHFGSTHFELHTGLSSTIVKAILDGFEAIDYERDEILQKIESTWSLPNGLISAMPVGFQMPEDIRNQLDLQLPLLDRQIKYLQKQMIRHREKKFVAPLEQTHVNQFPESLFDFAITEPEGIGEQSSLFFESSPMQSAAKTFDPLSSELTPHLKACVEHYLSTGVGSATALCELLIRNNHVDSERYHSGKSRIYPRVCLYLDSLVSYGRLKITQVTENDRVYQIL